MGWEWERCHFISLRAIRKAKMNSSCRGPTIRQPRAGSKQGLCCVNGCGQQRCDSDIQPASLFKRAEMLPATLSASQSLCTADINWRSVSLLWETIWIWAGHPDPRVPPHISVQAHCYPCSMLSFASCLRVSFPGLGSLWRRLSDAVNHSWSSLQTYYALLFFILFPLHLSAMKHNHKSMPFRQSLKRHLVVNKPKDKFHMKQSGLWVALVVRSIH